MLDGVERSAGRQEECRRVPERPGGENPARPEVLLDHLHHAAASTLDGLPHPRAVRLDRRGAEQGHAQRFGDHVHRVRGAETRADAGPTDGLPGTLSQPFAALVGPVQDMVDGGDEHLFDVHRLTPAAAGRLVAAREDEGRNVEPCRGHQVTGQRLVARGEADHPVQVRALDHRLDVERDQVACGEDVPTPAPDAGDEVAGGSRADLERHPTRCADDGLEAGSDLVQMAVADGEFR